MTEIPKKGITTGAILIILGGVGYLIGERSSLTSLAPIAFGLPLLLSSLAARKRKNLAIGIHVAAITALLGFLTPIGILYPKLSQGDFALEPTFLTLLFMMLVCAAFTQICLLSFRATRKKETQKRKQSL